MAETARRTMTLADVFERAKRQAVKRYAEELAEDEADTRQAAKAHDRYLLGLESGWWDERGNDIDDVPNEAEGDE